MTSFPEGFAPGDRLVMTWEKGSPAPAPAPTPLPPGPIPPLRVMPVADYQTPALPPLFPLPAGATPKGQSWWNVPVDALPVHAKSSTWLSTINSAARLHPDFSNASYGAGVPVNVVPGTQALRPVSPITYSGESDLSAAGYPVPDGAVVEGGDDAHLIVVDKDNRIAWEFYAFRLWGSTYWADQVSRWDLKADATRPAGWTSADAAGCCVLAGLVRYDEAAAGAINHAFRFTAAPTDHAYVAPASHFAAVPNANAPPMGARLRMKATVPVDPTLPAAVRTILAAMKKYGLILADNGTTGYVTGCPDARWNDDDLGLLKNFILGRDFEFVDTGAVPVTSAP